MGKDFQVILKVLVCVKSAEICGPQCFLWNDHIWTYRAMFVLIMCHNAHVDCTGRESGKGVAARHVHCLHVRLPAVLPTLLFSREFGLVFIWSCGFF